MYHKREVGPSQNARVFECVLQDRLLDSSENKTDI